MTIHIKCCDLCSAALEPTGGPRLSVEGATFTLGYSRGGWGTRRNFLSFSGEICPGCWDEYESIANGFSQWVAARRGVRLPIVTIFQNVPDVLVSMEATVEGTSEGMTVKSSKDSEHSQGEMMNIEDQTEDTAASETTPQTAKENESWAVVELMGHVRMAGRLSEEARFGAMLGRLDVPQEDGSFVTTHFSGAAIYRVTATTEDVARNIAIHGTARPIARLALPAGDGPDDEDEFDDSDPFENE